LYSDHCFKDGLSLTARFHFRSRFPYGFRLLPIAQLDRASAF
jgi:hypothetical protein